MGVISGGTIIPGSGFGGPYLNAGIPVNGTDEVQTLTIGGTPDGGTFKLEFDGHTTAAITWSATNNTLLANIDAALELLPNIGTGGVATADVSLSSGIGVLKMTFGGNQAKLNVPTMTVANNSLTGTVPTLAIAVSIAGVDATARGNAGAGAYLLDTTTGLLFTNMGTSLEPVWSRALQVRVLTQTVLKSAFTDGGAAVGTFDLTAGTLPIGAYVLFSKVVVGVAFSGDTSAVLTIGDGTDVDRYNTGTPSVFAAATDGLDMGDPSGVRMHVAAKTVKLTVTSATDFTNVNVLGSVTVSIYYVPTTA